MRKYKRRGILNYKRYLWLLLNTCYYTYKLLAFQSLHSNNITTVIWTLRLWSGHIRVARYLWLLVNACYYTYKCFFSHFRVFTSTTLQTVIWTLRLRSGHIPVEKNMTSSKHLLVHIQKLLLTFQSLHSNDITAVIRTYSSCNGLPHLSKLSLT